MRLVKKGNRILLVDDETDITTALKIALEDAGYIVHTYNDPLIALSEFKPGYYDLVILDIKMQEMNGFELYAEIRKVDNQVKFCFIIADQMYYDEARKEKREEGEEL
jgi:DNA-binding response OmpR family regulator